MTHNTAMGAIPKKGPEHRRCDEIKPNGLVATGVKQQNDNVARPLTNSSNSDIDPLWQQLAALIDGEVADSLSMRGAYATDASIYQQLPRAVAFPKHAQDVARIVKYCRDQGIAIVGRGAGTSLSGQAIGPGLVVDFSRHMDRILTVDADARLAVVEPGVVLDVLNTTLSRSHLLFAPDPATASRATIGGMIGNNACGTRSIVYGRTCDAIESLKTVMPDGTTLTTDWLDAQAWRHACQLPGAIGSLYRSLDALLADYGDDVRANIPNLPRIAAGYSVSRLVNSPDRRSLSDLIVGGEGTLALATEATLRLRDYPQATRLVISAFSSIEASLTNLPVALNSEPSAIELLDDVLIKEAVQNASTRDLIGAILPAAEMVPAAILMVEFFGDTVDQADQAARHYVALMQKASPGSRHHVLVQPEQQRAAWDVRRLGLGLVSNLPGKRKAIALIEDACLPIDKLPEYHRFVCEMGHRLDLGVSTYGHASVGVLHYKVMLDLHETDERRKMREMAESCFHKCTELGGVFSGEHGDGIVRAEFLSRQFGPRVYELFVAIKRLFDPRGLLNPGRKIDAPPLDSLLRYGDREKDRLTYLSQTALASSQFRYAEQGGLLGAIEQCNGVGACRQVLKGTMCPSYRATRDERDSTRGRANLLRLAISGQLHPPGLANPELHDALELCLACKACKSECPNAVDMARLKSDALAARWSKRSPPQSVLFLGRMPQRLKTLSRFARLANWSTQLKMTRWLLDRRFAIDRRRALPRLAMRSFDVWWAHHQAQPLSGTEQPSHAQSHPPTVALFVDAWNRYLEPEIAVAAVQLLRGLGIKVLVPQHFDALRSRISVGLLSEARQLAQPLYRELAAFVDRGIPIVCIEPSEASALIDDLPDLVEDEPIARRVAAKTFLIDDFIADTVRRGLARLEPVVEYAGRRVVVHPHCHQRALFTARSPIDILAQAGVAAELSDLGCCGMAGSFGYTHFDVSVAIAAQRFIPTLTSADPGQTVFVTTGTSCRQQSRDLIGIRSRHWLELVTAQPIV
mgnify:CR=1 FL=1